MSIPSASREISDAAREHHRFVGATSAGRARRASEPYEAGWAREAVIFVRALKAPKGEQPMARVEISPDGMRWMPEGTEAPMPDEKDGMAVFA